MLERALIEFASPTLARLKLGSLFTIPMAESLPGELAALGGQLEEKGLRLMVLRVRGGRALMYLVRPDELARSLADDAVWRFLETCGYGIRTLNGVLERLTARLEESPCFPHEIGVFLGYPLADVVGFIENDGRNCLCCGCWKVYSNPCDAQRAFARFRKCKAVYERLFASGFPLARLTVAARPA